MSIEVIREGNCLLLKTNRAIYFPVKRNDDESGVGSHDEGLNVNSLKKIMNSYVDIM